MPALYPAKCIECGEMHNLFCNDEDALTDGALYNFTCPTTGGDVLLSPTELNQVVQARPMGAVTLERLK